MHLHININHVVNVVIKHHILLLASKCQWTKSIYQYNSVNLVYSLTHKYRPLIIMMARLKIVCIIVYNNAVYELLHTHTEHDDRFITRGFQRMFLAVVLYKKDCKKLNNAVCKCYTRIIDIFVTETWEF